MSTYSMFMGWKTYYFKNINTTQNDLHIQCNPYQNANDFFFFAEIEKPILKFI